MLRQIIASFKIKSYLNLPQFIHKQVNSFQFQCLKSKSDLLLKSGLRLD